LTNLYIEEGVVPVKYRYDAYHIASTTFHNLDYLLSFNCKHINNETTKHLVKNINKREGYKSILINIPMKVLDVKE
jgi:hypothetical protein